MKRLQPSFRVRWIPAAFALFAALAISPVAANAVATMFFDRENFRPCDTFSPPCGAGLGMTQTTANNVSGQGIPMVHPVGGLPVPGLDQTDVGQSLLLPTLLIGPPATITSDWTIHNDTGKD